jgi:hypothetical protein
MIEYLMGYFELENYEQLQDFLVASFHYTTKLICT